MCCRASNEHDDASPIDNRLKSKQIKVESVGAPKTIKTQSSPVDADAFHRSASLIWRSSSLSLYTPLPPLRVYIFYYQYREREKIVGFNQQRERETQDC